MCMFVSLITKKAFDTVKHEPLIELLQSLDIDPQDCKHILEPTSGSKTQWRN